MPDQKESFVSDFNALAILKISTNQAFGTYAIFLLTGLRIYTGEYKAQGPT